MHMIYESLQKAGNYDEGQWIWGEGQLRFRTMYHRDGYENQSWIRTEMWTAAGWTTVIRQDGYEVEMPSTYRGDKPMPEKEILALVAAQQEITRLVVRH